MNATVIERAVPDDALTATGDGWTVFGRAVPYGHDQRVTDDGRTWYTERFARGAFARDAKSGGRWVNLFLGHGGDEGERWLGRCVGLDDRPDGLYAGFRLNRDHPRAEAARSGDLRGWSVSAKVRASRVDYTMGAPVTVREDCSLSHVAATSSPQYLNTGVLVARAAHHLNRPPLFLPNTRHDRPTVIYPTDRAGAWARTV